MTLTLKKRRGAYLDIAGSAPATEGTCAAARRASGLASRGSRRRKSANGTEGGRSLLLS
jgi:hypothetical protein